MCSNFQRVEALGTKLDLVVGDLLHEDHVELVVLEIVANSVSDAGHDFRVYNVLL